MIKKIIKNIKANVIRHGVHVCDIYTRINLFTIDVVDYRFNINRFLVYRTLNITLKQNEFTDYRLST